MTSPHLDDAHAREEALNPHGSFIVQAPAGSGKTGLLTQRFLRLLSLVEHPEELIAITFTRKAAAEMKNRVLDALHMAQDPAPDDADVFAKRTWQLAWKALQHDQKQAWKILESPGRLRILTMDALCANLIRQLPFLSGLGGRFSITEEAQDYYAHAARATLEEGKTNKRWSPSVACLLDHLDNNVSVAETLLTKMLARRDQWLRHIGGRPPDARIVLEDVLRQVIVDALTTLDRAMTEGEKREVWMLAGFAGEMLRRTNPSAHLATCDAAHPFPSTTPEAHTAWLGLADLLLTNQGTWRKRLDAKGGFPSASQGKSPQEKTLFKKKKAEAATLIQTFSTRPTLLEALVHVRTLPPPTYTPTQWRILEALLELLPMAVAQLHVQFQDLGKVDFPEVTKRAEAALDDPDGPTDLAMKLDYRIRHLLIDEFQDTSHSHYRILEHLTAGWDGQDGRSLFVVGDPMQSIYRFREAEVGLFLKTRRDGMGTMTLTSLTLTVNFRSQASLVHWTNAMFKNVFPDTEDSAVGAVSFNPSSPFRPAWDGPAVEVHPFCTDDRLAEAEQVAVLALRAQTEPHQRPGKTAILVRSRTHLTHILPALDRAGVRYQGVDIESLATSMVIQDLLSLTRALTYPADHLAWLAVLRAPWCGLSLADLYVLVQAMAHAPKPQTPPTPSTLWEGIVAQEAQAQLTEDGQCRLNRFKTVMLDALKQRRRCHAFPGVGTLRFWVENTWQALGGPATIQRAQALGDAERFFDLLTATERGGTLPDFAKFSQKVTALYSAGEASASEASLVIMTIHKAKGLEFDTVILPGLGRMPRREEKSLLAWMEHPAGLLLGPIKRSDQESDDLIHTLIRKMEQRKTLFETGRLLYVAATRARKQLHLLGHIKACGDTSKPAPGSFLKHLWGHENGQTGIAHFFHAVERSDSPETAPSNLTHAPPPPPPLLRCLATDWSRPPPPPPFRETIPDLSIDEEPVLFEWAGETVRLVGIVVHRFLHAMAHEGIALWTPHHIHARRPAFFAHLGRLGVPEQSLKMAGEMVEKALMGTVADDRGLWILDNDRHDAPCSEFAITGLVGGRVQRMVLDRTFIDRQGTRWIIDFKTSLHRGGDLDAFLDNERIRYQDQMARYGALMKKHDQNQSTLPIRLGLYFPMHSAWRAWSWDEDNPPAS